MTRFYSYFITKYKSYKRKSENDANENELQSSSSSCESSFRSAKEKLLVDTSKKFEQTNYFDSNRHNFYSPNQDNDQSFKRGMMGNVAKKPNMFKSLPQSATCGK